MKSNDLGSLIAARRASMGMTQDRLAKLAGVSAGMIGHVESGRRSLSHEALDKVAKALKWPADERAALDAARDQATRRLGARMSPLEMFSSAAGELGYLTLEITDELLEYLSAHSEADTIAQWRRVARKYFDEHPDIAEKARQPLVVSSPSADELAKLQGRVRELEQQMELVLTDLVSLRRPRREWPPAPHLHGSTSDAR